MKYLLQRSTEMYLSLKNCRNKISEHSKKQSEFQETKDIIHLGALSANGPL